MTNPSNLHHAGDILGNSKVRISGPGEKVPLKSFLKFYFGTKHQERPLQREVVRLQVPLSSSQVLFYFLIMFSQSLNKFMCSLRNEVHVSKNNDLDLFCKYYIEHLKYDLRIPLFFLMCCSVRDVSVEIPILKTVVKLM